MKIANIIAGAAALVGAYFVYNYFKKPKANGAEKQLEPNSGGQSKSGTSSSSSSFPLKKGSRNALVTTLQQLILKIDKTLLPKYGADGDFGSETEAAVKKLLNKKTVDSQNDFNTLNQIMNKKLFPLITSVPNNSGVPMYDPKKIF